MTYDQELFLLRRGQVSWQAYEKNHTGFAPRRRHPFDRPCNRGRIVSIKAVEGRYEDIELGLEAITKL